MIFIYQLSYLRVTFVLKPILRFINASDTSNKPQRYKAAIYYYEQKNVLLHFRIKIYENKTFTMTIHDSYARIFWTQIKIPFVVN